MEVDERRDFVRGQCVQKLGAEDGHADSMGNGQLAYNWFSCWRHLDGLGERISASTVKPPNFVRCRSGRS